MNIPIKTLMKKTGVTLKDVAEHGNFSVSTVSRALDEELILSVREKAIDLIYERNKFYWGVLKHMKEFPEIEKQSDKATEAKDGSPEPAAQTR